VINQKKVSIKTLNFPTKERDNIALHCFQSVLCSDGVVISIFECERLRLVFEFQMRLNADQPTWTSESNDIRISSGRQLLSCKSESINPKLTTCLQLV